MLLHLLVLAPFVAAVLMAATSKEDPKSSSRLAFLFGYAFVALSIALIASGNQATEAIEWFHIPGAKGSVYYYLYSHGLGAWMVLLSTSLSLVALMTARNTLDTNYRNFAIGIFALMGAMNGTFLAADAVLLLLRSHGDSGRDPDCRLWRKGTHEGCDDVRDLHPGGFCPDDGCPLVPRDGGGQFPGAFSCGRSPESGSCSAVDASRLLPARLYGENPDFPVPRLAGDYLRRGSGSAFGYPYGCHE